MPKHGQMTPSPVPKLLFGFLGLPGVSRTLKKKEGAITQNNGVMDHFERVMETPGSGWVCMYPASSTYSRGSEDLGFDFWTS